MRKMEMSIFVCVMLIVSAGCQSSPNRAPEGAVIGGALGAGLGAIIGHQSGETGEGAALGAGAGALAGALIGSQQQKQPQQAQQKQVQSNNPNQMSVTQIVDLSKQGVHEEVIVDRIKMSGSRFNLSQGDIDYLRNQGVTQKVINAMQGW